MNIYDLLCNKFLINVWTFKSLFELKSDNQIRCIGEFETSDWVNWSSKFNTYYFYDIMCVSYLDSCEIFVN